MNDARTKMACCQMVEKFVIEINNANYLINRLWESFDAITKIPTRLSNVLYGEVTKCLFFFSLFLLHVCQFLLLWVFLYFIYTCTLQTRYKHYRISLPSYFRPFSYAFHSPRIVFYYTCKNLPFYLIFHP